MATRPIARSTASHQGLNQIGLQRNKHNGTLLSKVKQTPSIALLHAARALRRWVLACFVGALLVAVASPLVHARAMEWICSTAGMVKVYVQTDDGPVEMGQTAMDCPLCMPHGAPLPPVAMQTLPQPLPLGHAVQAIPAARIAAATAAPLPARGPPGFQHA